MTKEDILEHLLMRIHFLETEIKWREEECGKCTAGSYDDGYNGAMVVALNYELEYVKSLVLDAGKSYE